jgi:hypothetical protein
LTSKHFFIVEEFLMIKQGEGVREERSKEERQERWRNKKDGGRGEEKGLQIVLEWSEFL